MVMVVVVISSPLPSSSFSYKLLSFIHRHNSLFLHLQSSFPKAGIIQSLQMPFHKYK